MLTKGVQSNGGYLPFIPAQKLTHSIRMEKNTAGKISTFYIEPEYVHVFRQNDAAVFETATPSYDLVNLYAGITIPKGKSNMTISLAGQNLLNEAYADHLSRLKYYGLLNPGRNITLNLHIPIN